MRAYLVAELNKALLGRVLWRQQIVNGEEEQEELDHRPHGIVLIARLDVSDDDVATGNALELER